MGRRLALLLLLEHVAAFERIACLGDSIVRGDTKHEEEDEWVATEDGGFRPSEQQGEQHSSPRMTELERRFASIPTYDRFL